MKLKILGSGGAMPTPRPFCDCNICKQARNEGAPFVRNSSSLYLEEIKTVIDAPEDIGSSLNREKISKVENLFITHWHPDHTFGLRVILEANYNFRDNTPNDTINLYVPEEVLITLREKYPVIDYYQEGEGVAKIILIKDGDKIKIGSYEIEAVKYNKGSDVFGTVYGYLLKNSGKKALYTPCDTISYKRDIKGLDLLITEMGLLEKHETEITFEKMMDRLRKGVADRVVLTHIEEIDMQLKGYNYLQELKRKYSDVKFDYATDGMEIVI